MNPSERLSDTGLAIFLFHGVVRRAGYAVRNYTHKHLLQDRFFGIMQDLRNRGQALSMDEVAAHCRTHEPFPPGAFAVTFDDGFENNYSIAAPILKDLSVPATFYVTTAFVQENAMSWIDRAEHCLEQASPGTLKFYWEQKARTFGSPGERIAILEYLRQRVKSDSSIDVDRLVSTMFQQCRVPEIHDSDEPIDRKMNWEQVTKLADDDLFTVGGHSHGHVILSFLTAAQLEREVGTSVDLLDQKVGLHLRHYSYPEGLDYCYSDRVIRKLQAKGIVCCPTAVDGINDQHSDLFRLRRIMVT